MKPFKTNSFLSIGIGLLIGCSVFAQDFTFSNYRQASFMYNPAAMVETGNIQFTLNYRNTGLTKDVYYNTSMFSMQAPLNYQWKKLNAGTAGFGLYDDRMNNVSLVSTTGLALAYAQPVQVTEHSTLSAGIQVNYYQMKLNLDGYTTGSQWNEYTGYNGSLGNGEANTRDNVKCFSINSGLYWRLADQSGNTKAYIGSAIYNLNRPDESFTNQAYQPYWRYTLQGGYKVIDNGMVNFLPELLYVGQGKQRFFNGGFRVGYSLAGTNPNVPFKTGQISMSVRAFSTKALSVGLILDQPFYAIGTSYDFDMNSSLPGNTNSTEVFLIVRLNRGGEQPKKLVAQDYYIGQVREFVEEKKQDTALLGKVPAKEMKKNKRKDAKPLSLAIKRDFKFAFNDATLTGESKAYLDDMAVLLEENEDMSIEIIGHTDDVGSAEGNRIISEKRARVVADYLISKGIAESRIKITGKMDKDPLFPNTSPEYRAKNRRVEFIINY